MNEKTADELLNQDTNHFIAKYFQCAPVADLWEAWDWMSNPYTNEEPPSLLRKTATTRYAIVVLFGAWAEALHGGNRVGAFLELVGVLNLNLEDMCYV